MPAAEPLHVTSRDNALLVKLRRLAQDGAAYRKLGEVWLEGDHLCRAARMRGHRPPLAVLSEPGWQDEALRELADAAERVVIVPERLFQAISGLVSPAQLGFLLTMPPALAVEPAVPSVVLDRVQDAGNVGSILRSAAALGIGQVLAIAGTAALWSPKVMRAGMGAHFALRLVEGLAADSLAALRMPLVATSSHATDTLPHVALPRPCTWVFGHEGQGVDANLLRRCALMVRIPQPGGEESLNVAAAAAICFYEADRQAGAAR